MQITFTTAEQVLSWCLMSTTEDCNQMTKMSTWKLFCTQTMFSRSFTQVCIRPMRKLDYNAGAVALAGQPMLRQSSSCKIRRYEEWRASSVEVHCLRCHRQMGWPHHEKTCSVVVVASSLLLARCNRPVLREQDQDRQRTVSSGLETKTAVSRTTSRPSPPALRKIWTALYYNEQLYSPLAEVKIQYNTIQ